MAHCHGTMFVKFACLLHWEIISVKDQRVCWYVVLNKEVSEGGNEEVRGICIDHGPSNSTCL